MPAALPSTSASGSQLDHSSSVVWTNSSARSYRNSWSKWLSWPKFCASLFVSDVTMCHATRPWVRWSRLEKVSASSYGWKYVADLVIAMPSLDVTQRMAEAAITRTQQRNAVIDNRGQDAGHHRMDIQLQRRVLHCRHRIGVVRCV